MTAFQKVEALRGQRYDRDKMLAVVQDVTTHFRTPKSFERSKMRAVCRYSARCSPSLQRIKDDDLKLLSARWSKGTDALGAALCSVGVFSRTPKRGSARHGRKQRMTASELVENACVPDRFQQVLCLSASGQNSRATVKGHERRPEEGGRTLVLGLDKRCRKMHRECGVRLSWGCPGFIKRIERSLLRASSP
jgi:hypothetical protein